MDDVCYDGTEESLRLGYIEPKSPKQKEFIHSEANVTVFGGAAGAGKSFLGCMDFLQYTDYPKFRGLITRRTTPQLKGPGGILDNAMDLYQKKDPKVRWKDKDGYFQFTSGARIYLRHFETLSSKDNFQGSEVNLFLVDEGQQYEEAMVTYLMSRMRNPKCPEVPPHMKITCNPDYDSFLRKWLEWYLDPETGIPLPERDGVIRWFVVQDGKMRWASSRLEAIEKYGKPDLDPNHNRQVKPLSFKFVSANVYDNPVLMHFNPEYVSWLEGLGRVEKERLLHGSWLAREESSGYWKKEWVEEVALAPLGTLQRVRAWDISGTLPSDTNPNPDWTAGVLISKDKHSLYYIEDVVRDRRRHGGVEELILETAARDGTDTTILIPCDPGAAGKAYAAQLVRVLAEAGYTARIKTTNKSKVTRFAPFAALCEAGGVRMVRGPWNEDYTAELERFDGTRNIKDDQVDASADAFMHLASNIHIPDFMPPDMQQANPFAIYR